MDHTMEQQKDDQSSRNPAEPISMSAYTFVPAI